MTSYYSALFFTAFLPITVMLYGMAPRRFRWAVLLLASYGFFFALSGALIAFVALSTAVVGSLAVLVAIIWMLKESALQGDWRTIEDTIGTWFVSAAAFSLVIGTLAVVICAKGARK